MAEIMVPSSRIKLAKARLHCARKLIESDVLRLFEPLAVIASFGCGKQSHASNIIGVSHGNIHN